MIPVCLMCGKDILPPNHHSVPHSYYERKYHRACRSVALHQQFLNSAQTRDIVSLCEQGEETLEAIGDHFGLTRERIRQIYKKATGKGKPYAKKSKAYREMRREEKAAKREAFLSRISFVCTVCQTPVSVRERKRGLTRLCRVCARLSKETHRNLEVWVVCRECGVRFHPYRNTGRAVFHNQACYFRFQRRRRELGIPFRAPVRVRGSRLFDSLNTS